MKFQQFYVALKKEAFQNAETISHERYDGNRFLCIDIKEVENEYHILFIDKLNDFQVMPLHKLRFDGFVDEKAPLLIPFIQSGISSKSTSTEGSVMITTNTLPPPQVRRQPRKQAGKR
jgi:hypothetical protein